MHLCSFTRIKVELTNSPADRGGAQRHFPSKNTTCTSTCLKKASETIKESDLIQESESVSHEKKVSASGYGTVPTSDTSSPPPTLYVVSDGLQSDREGELCILIHPLLCTPYTCTPTPHLTPPTQGAPLHLCT